MSLDMMCNVQPQQTCAQCTQSQQPEQAQQACPAGCCKGNEILCISIPCPVSIVLLGIDLTLELPCVRLTSKTPLTAAQINNIIQTLTRILGSLTPSL